MSVIEQFAAATDELIISARLQDIAEIARSERADRLSRLAAVIAALGPGHYLIGCGPYNTGIIRLGPTDIILGRSASPLEEMSDTVVDYCINDAVYLGPREVSRVHAAIRVDRDETGSTTCLLRDEDSTCGTYLNGRQIGEGDCPNPAMIEAGDIVTLGPSGINAYLCIQIVGSQRPPSL